jgi:hypothetical protein
MEIMVGPWQFSRVLYRPFIQSGGNDGVGCRAERTPALLLASSLLLIPQSLGPANVV